MKKGKSLQEIEDFYINQGLTGTDLRKALEKDKEYQELLRKRKVRLTKKFKISKKEQDKYVLSTDQDYEILGKIHQLEQLPLSDEDKRLVSFIRTQLEPPWRAGIFKVLNRLLEKYQK